MPAVDVLIRGAGPVGCTLALALRDSGLSVFLCDRKIESNGKPLSLRPIALSHASRLILARADAWDALETTPIEAVHVSQAGRFGRTRLDAADAGVPALGYVIDYGALTRGLRVNVSVHDAKSPPEARCVVHAEGVAQGEVRERDYRHEALTAQIEASPPARADAHERFAADGPIALLPMAGRYGLVWSLAPERAARLVDAPPQEFLAALAGAFGPRAGRFVGVAGRARTPLTLRVRRARISGNEVYIGNAAQTLHPVAGQGLNLGLRDAWDLAETLRGAPGAALPHALARFAARRRLDAAMTIRVTDSLARAFLGANPFAGAARGLAMAALDAAPPARRFFARRMIFGAGAMP